MSLLNSEQLPYLPALILANRVEGWMSKEQARLAVLSEFDSWAKKHPNDASMMAVTTSGQSFTAGFEIRLKRLAERPPRKFIAYFQRGSSFL